MINNKDFIILNNIDTSYIDEILIKDGFIQPVAAQSLVNIPQNDLMKWATDNAIYQFITTELIDFIKTEIASLKTIEICAGNGIISRSLGILGTDSYMQYKPHIKAYYDLLQNEITKPPKEIKKYEALEAIRVFRPECVIGAFVSQKTTLSEYHQGIVGSPYGVNERELLKKVKKYILIGNQHTHRFKHIFNLPHREEYYPWLITKSLDQSKNRIWIWENH